MKAIKLLFATVIAFVTFQSGTAHSDKTQRTAGIITATIKIYGECTMCKKKIETAAYSVAGIKSEVWNEDSKLLTIKYSVFKKEAIDNVQRNISSAGYDTEQYRSGDAAYLKLPGCCQYQRKQS